jgi:hypothetical protein
VYGQKLNFTTLNGSWKNLQHEAVHDCRRFDNQQQEIRNSLMLACEVLRNFFPVLEEGLIQESLGIS